MNRKELIVTVGTHPLTHPYEKIELSSPYMWSLHYSLEEAIKKFISEVSELDSGSVQLWQKNLNNDTWFEMGHLYL
jgi:hypothetical protein